MGSTRDRALDLTRTRMGARLPLATHPRLRPIASPATPPPGRQPMPRGHFRGTFRSRQDSRSTDQSNCQWAKRFTFLHNLRQPTDMAEAEISAILINLALKGKVSARRRPKPSARCSPFGR